MKAHSTRSWNIHGTDDRRFVLDDWNLSIVKFNGCITCSSPMPRPNRRSFKMLLPSLLITGPRVPTKRVPTRPSSLRSTKSQNSNTPPQLVKHTIKMDESTPRINASYLENFQNQRVRFVGKVVRLQGDRATVDCGGQITLILNRVCAC